jgi:MFS family permease
VAGPALGGVVGAWLGLGGVAVIDATTYLIAGGLIAAIGSSGRPEQEQEHTGTTAPEAMSEAINAWRRVWHEWRAGVRLVRDSRILGLVFAATAVFAVGDVGYSALLAVWVRDVLGGGAREFGWLVTGQAVGGMLGAALLASWGRDAPLRRLLGWGMVGMGVLDVAFVTYPTVVDGVWLGILLRVAIGFPVMAANTSATALLQQETADRYRGRVFGARSMTFSLVILILAPLAGLATEWVGIVPVLTLLSATSIPVGLVLLRLLGDHRSGVAGAGG